MQTSSLQLDDRYSSEHSPSWSGTRVCLTKPGSSVNVVQKSHSLKLFYFFFRVNTKTEDVKFKVDRQNKDMYRILGKKWTANQNYEREKLNLNPGDVGDSFLGYNISLLQLFSIKSHARNIYMDTIVGHTVQLIYSF